MHYVQTVLIRRSIAGLLTLSAALARRPGLQAVSFAWSRWLARQTIRRRRIGPTRWPAELAVAWQRGFPAAKQVPIDEITGDTAYARITTPCPLRGGGDTAACWRMMEYDRTVAAAAGGQFVVLQSQAEPGVTACRVALRSRNAATDDLVPAHIRAPGP